ncbi:hypothetical protein GJ496_011655 [Pomphorhynchus laevis]|nr:hypothetical protein GJ496_011655 [Pomphorhynchus laevis]
MDDINKFDDITSEENNLPATANSSNSKRRRIFTKELRCMMYGFGDDKNPFDESVDFLEDIVIEYMTNTALRAAAVRQGPRIQPEDLLFTLRYDERKYSRTLELLSMNEELKRARKAFDDDKY